MKETLNKLVEKIKSLDKKILIGGGIGLVLVIVLVIALVIGLGKKPSSQELGNEVTENDVETEDETEVKDEEETEDETEETTAVFQVTVVDADGNPVEGVTVQVCKDTCVPATTDASGVATFEIAIEDGHKLSVLSCPEGYEYTGEAEIALESGAATHMLQISAVEESEEGEEAEESEETTSSSSDKTNSSDKTSSSSSSSSSSKKNNSDKTSSSSSSSSSSSNKGSSSSSSSSSSSKGEQLEVTEKEDGTEILGVGTKDNPYLETPDLDSMTLKTVKIPAGKTYYYGIYRVGNMILTINDSDAYVIESDGTKHTAKNGKVSFTVEDALASDCVMFQIGNSGSSAQSFTIKFTNQTGSYANPTVIKKMGSQNEVSLDAGNNIGHYYSYKAEKTGTIHFYIVKATADSVLNVTNNSNSAMRSTNADEDVLTDANGNEYIELEVTKGDEIIINVGALPNRRGVYPASDITWYGKYN